MVLLGGGFILLLLVLGVLYAWDSFETRNRGGGVRKPLMYTPKQCPHCESHNTKEERNTWRCLNCKQGWSRGGQIGPDGWPIPRNRQGKLNSLRYWLNPFRKDFGTEHTDDLYSKYGELWDALCLMFWTTLFLFFLVVLPLLMLPRGYR